MLYASYMKKNKKIYRAKHDNVIFNAIKTIEDTAMRSLFIDCNRVTGDIQFPLLTTIGDNGLQRAFYNCINITGISFPKLATIGEYGLESAFQNCTSISGSISFPELTTIDRFGLNYAFQNCTNITSVYFPKLTTINTWGLDYAFSGCTNLTELHFRYDMENVIQNNKFGASNATLYFDLGMARVNIIPNVQDCDIYFKGQLASNPLLMPVGVESTYYVYKDGYCLYIGSKNISEADEGKTLTENITLTTSGKVTTFNITLPENNLHPTTDISIEYTIDGIKIKTDTISNVSTNSTCSVTSTISVPENTSITYKIKSTWHNSVTGSVTPSNNTLNITLENMTKAVLDFSYPFTENSEYLVNLVDGSNFIIFNTTDVPPSCIVSGSNSYHKDSGFSIGYIEFTTPDTDDVDFLTLSITCTTYAETYDDYGVIFINTTGTMPTANISLSTYEGSNSTYGYILYQSYNTQSSTFRTVTKVLEKNTKYYLGFYYRKDSSLNRNWDRLAIQNIKIPVAI